MVAALPEIWFLKDTDGDNRGDLKIACCKACAVLIHTIVPMHVVGPGCWIYWSRGIFIVAAFETPTRLFRTGDSGVHRFNPRTFEVEFHYPIGPNPHGDVFDRWDSNSPMMVHQVRAVMSVSEKACAQVVANGSRKNASGAATGILSSSHFPETSQNNFLVCNTLAFSAYSSMK